MHNKGLSRNRVVRLSFLLRNRFWILYTGLFFVLAVNTSNGIWFGDFWEHSAVINALLGNLTNPSHPFFAVDGAHAFTSPYALTVAVLAKSMHLSSIDALGLFGLINFSLLGFGLYKVASTLSENDADSIAFYWLLSILFLWGSNPWGYSGFLHWGVLAAVLPYPSTFSIALTLIVVSMNVEPHRFASFRSVAIILLGLIVLLSHPLTFIGLAIILGCQILARLDLSLSQRFFHLLLFLFVTGTAGLAWPYFSLFELLHSEGRVYHPYNVSMYEGVLARIWPTIIAIPLLWFGIKSHASKIYLLSACFMMLIFFYGLFTQQYSFGRIIAFTILLIHLLQSRGVASLENSALLRWPRGTHFTLGACVIFFAYVSMPTIKDSISRFLTLANSIRINRQILSEITYKDLSLISQHVYKDRIVLTDLETSGKIPSFGGKVVASPHPLAFIKDDNDRRAAVEMFFSSEATATQRHKILKDYMPDFLLINKQAPEDYSSAFHFVLDSGATLILETSRYSLFEMRYDNTKESIQK